MNYVIKRRRIARVPSFFRRPLAQQDQRLGRAFGAKLWPQDVVGSRTEKKEERERENGREDREKNENEMKHA